MTGPKIGWIFAWRTLIAAELVFGLTAVSCGLGWCIFQSRNELYRDRVSTGLITVILIGRFIENVIFQVPERFTVRRWGVQQ